jgi:hypothetical protein
MLRTELRNHLASELFHPLTMFELTFSVSECVDTRVSTVREGVNYDVFTHL